MKKPLEVRCPLLGCRADVGEPCISLVSPTFYNSPGKNPPIKRPHEARRDFAKLITRMEKEEGR